MADEKIVRIAVEYSGRFYTRRTDHFVVVQDLVGTSDRETVGKHLTELQAFALARKTAKERNLFYDTYIYTSDELVRGREQTCPGCGLRGHSWKTYLCGACRARLESAGTGKRYAVEARIYPYHYSADDYAVKDRLEEAWTDMMLGLTGNVGAREVNEWRSSDGEGEVGLIVAPDTSRAYGGPRVRVVTLTDPQVDAMRRLHALVADTCRASYEAGVRQGSSILGQLASGKIDTHAWALAREQSRLEKEVKGG